MSEVGRVLRENVRVRTRLEVVTLGTTLLRDVFIGSDIFIS